MTCGGSKGTMTRGAMHATKGPRRVRLIDGHGRLATSKGSLTCIAIGIMSGSNGLYPASDHLVRFSMGKTNGFQTITGNSPAGLRRFRLPGVRTFRKVLATVMRTKRVTKSLMLATGTDKIGAKAIRLRTGWGNEVVEGERVRPALCCCLNASCPITLYGRDSGAIWSIPGVLGSVVCEWVSLTVPCNLSTARRTML